MADYFVFVDETGTPDFTEGNSRDLPYFGFGSLVVIGDHSEMLWEIGVLRLALNEQGVELPAGFHTKDDSWNVRTQLLSLLDRYNIKLHSSFYLKKEALSNVGEVDKERFYKWALYCHMKALCEEVIPQDAKVYFVLATIGTARMRKFAREAAQDIANQMPQNVVVCFWDASTSFGLQVADLLLWCTQRDLMGRQVKQHNQLVAPLIAPVSTPWGVHKS